MKFEVRYPTGEPHEVTLQGTVAILGRDPSCDLVLNDPRCSRRHAVLEAGPQGLSIRDTGSANGVVVNGEKVERAGLKPGDEVRLGEIVIKVLPEEMPGTVVMGPDEIADFPGAGPPAAGAPGSKPSSTTSLPPLAAPPPAPPRAAPPAAPAAPPSPPALPVAPAAPPRPRAAMPARPVAPRPPAAEPAEADLEELAGPIPRSMVVTLLAVLWSLAVLLYAAAGLWLATTSDGMARVAAVGIGGLLSLLSAAMAVGLWMRAGWARVLQIALAGLGVLSCAFAPVSIAILVYMLRPEARRQFSGLDLSELPEEELEAATADSSGLPFTFAILAALLVSWLLAAGGAALLGTLGMGAAAMGRAQASASESAAVANLRTMASAQEAFRAGTCDGYADLEGLMNPASAIPNYPPGGPAFLSAEFAQAERFGYRYELRVGEAIQGGEACPSRLYRRYSFAAEPSSGAGRHFLLQSDGLIRVAEDRPAGPQDPPLQ